MGSDLHEMAGTNLGQSVHKNRVETNWRCVWVLSNDADRQGRLSGLLFRSYKHSNLSLLLSVSLSHNALFFDRERPLALSLFFSLYRRWKPPALPQSPGLNGPYAGLLCVMTLVANLG